MPDALKEAKRRFDAGKLMVRAKGRRRNQHDLRAFILHFKPRGRCDVTVVTDTGIQQTLRRHFRYGTGQTLMVTANDLLAVLRETKLKKD